VIVLHDDGVRLCLRRVRPRDRLAARLRTATFDRQLAEGVAPETSVALAVRADRLCGRSHRRLLARSLRSIASSSEPAGSRLRVPVARQAVGQVRADLVAVAERLDADGPIGARAVARVRGLLTDGTGPLYQQTTAARLRRELRAALDAMDAPA
jgi:hypothetical protein